MLRVYARARHSSTSEMRTGTYTREVPAGASSTYHTSLYDRSIPGTSVPGVCTAVRVVKPHTKYIYTYLVHISRQEYMHGTWYQYSAWAWFSRLCRAAVTTSLYIQLAIAAGGREISCT